MDFKHRRLVWVLLVEHHSETAVSFAKLLQMDGFIVHVAPGFSAALKLAAKYRFDVLLSDISLPDGSGADLMRTLLAENQAIKGIAVSGYGDPENVKVCEDAGFSAHLLKPVDFRNVQEVLSRICEDIHLMREEDGSIGPSLEYLRHLEARE